MFLGTDLKNLSKEQLEERLQALRADRKARYTAPKRKISAKAASINPLLEGVDENIAAKILADLTKMLEIGSEDDK